MDETKPCLLPEQKERLEMTYGKELDYYGAEIERMKAEDSPDERVLIELEARRQKAEDNLNLAQSMEPCEVNPADQEAPEESEPQQ